MDELGNDLDGLTALQRRLKGLEGDMAAIEAKVGLFYLIFVQN